MKPILLAGLLLVFLFSGSCAPRRGFDSQLNSIVAPYLFSIAVWESRTIPAEVRQWISGEPVEIDDEISLVMEYFSATRRIKSLKSAIGATNTGDGESSLAPLEAELDRLQERKLVLAATVERILEKQIRDTVTQQGIFNPLIGLKVSFPPVNFKLEKPPHLLVISPRERIESTREIHLKPNLNLKEKVEIETGVDDLGVSSLVVALGGLGATYPTFVTNEAGLRFTLDTAVEEWLHQYLAFKPLGFRYLLDLTGLSRNYEIATMNETVASIVSKEIGAIVYEKYYSEYENGANQDRATESAFDFNREMREIRRTVDAYLADGEIELAEQFMENRRQYLVAKGYYIRKLNQAYFAFHGAYADKPAFISPIGLELKELRAQSASLRDFLNTAAGMNSRQDLKKSVTAAGAVEEPRRQ